MVKKLKVRLFYIAHTCIHTQESFLKRTSLLTLIRVTRLASVGIQVCTTLPVQWLRTGVLRLPKVEGTLSCTLMCKQVSLERRNWEPYKGEILQKCACGCVWGREREREIMRLRKGQMFREVCRWSAFNLLCPCILAELVKMPILGVLEWGPRFCISNKRATLLISGPRFELKGPKSPPLQRSSKKITCLNFVF